MKCLQCCTLSIQIHYVLRQYWSVGQPCRQARNTSPIRFPTFCMPAVIKTPLLWNYQPLLRSVELIWIQNSCYHEAMAHYSSSHRRLNVCGIVKTGKVCPISDRGLESMPNFPSPPSNSGQAFRFSIVIVRSCPTYQWLKLYKDVSLPLTNGMKAGRNDLSIGYVLPMED